MITYNFSTPDVPPLNYSLKEQRYAAQFTIVLDDSSYNATNDLGMFVNAIDTGIYLVSLCLLKKRRSFS
jgi:hypothetical protein